VPEFIEIQPAPKELNLIGVTGHPLKLFRKATLPHKLSDNLVIEQACIVCDDDLLANKSGLFVIDFLSDDDALLRAKTNEMFIKGQIIALRSSRPKLIELFIVSSRMSVSDNRRDQVELSRVIASRVESSNSSNVRKSESLLSEIGSEVAFLTNQKNIRAGKRERMQSNIWNDIDNKLKILKENKILQSINTPLSEDRATKQLPTSGATKNLLLQRTLVAGSEELSVSTPGKNRNEACQSNADTAEPSLAPFVAEKNEEYRYTREVKVGSERIRVTVESLGSDRIPGYELRNQYVKLEKALKIRKSNT